MGPTCVGEMLRNGLEESKCCVELGSTLIRTYRQSGKCQHDGLLLRPSQPHQNKAKTERQLILVSGATMNAPEDERLLTLHFPLRHADCVMACLRVRTYPDRR